MLVIQNIKIKFQKSVIPVKLKTIRIGYNQSYSSNQKKYQQLTTHLFQWHQSITLPLYYNVPLQCTCRTDQNYDNPEDPNAQLQARIKIIDYKQNQAEGALFNKSKEKVAVMTLTFRIFNQRMIVPDDKGRVLISSILAHFQDHYGSKGFMQISIGYKTLFTPTVKVIAGELLWSQELAIPMQETNSFKGVKEDLVMRIIVDEKVVGVIKFKVESIKNMTIKYKKFKIMDAEDENKVIGTLFLDITYKDKLQKEQEKFLQNQYSLSLKKKDDSLRKKQSSQRVLNLNFNLNKQQEKQSSRSQRMLPSIIRGSQSSQALLHLDTQPQNPKKPKRKDPQLFAGVFNLGVLDKQQNIRQIFKERRARNLKLKNGSLPKLK